MKLPQEANTQNKLLTTKQAADLLGLQPTTLEQWRWTGRGPRFVKLNRACRYRITDLESFMEERLFRSTTEAHRAGG